jgi:hypothetical protein
LGWPSSPCTCLWPPSRMAKDFRTWRTQDYMDIVSKESRYEELCRYAWQIILDPIQRSCDTLPAL